MSQYISYDTYQVLSEERNGYDIIQALQYVKKPVRLTRFELMGYLRTKYPDVSIETIGRALKLAMGDERYLTIGALSLYQLEIEFS